MDEPGRAHAHRAARGAEVDRLRFAFASCQEYQAGYWPAHTHLAAEDVDLVVFLGDYVYENEPDADAVRSLRSAAPTDLAGYRLRYGEYKADPALQAAHAAVPWICTWDDHEVANNYAGEVPDGVGAEAGDDGFRDRRAAAYQAWYEHTPARVEPPDGPDATVYRSLRWGDLARFYMLDGRQYRNDQACGAADDVGLACAEVGDDDRTMLGADQERWLGRALDDTDARWNVIAQQTIVSRIVVPLGADEGLNLDQWDGYPAARRRLVDQLREVDNPVIITGDIHASGVGVVTDDPDDPATPAAVPELVGTSISSTFPAAFVELVETAAAATPSIRYVEPRRRGYVVCEVTADDLTADFRYVGSTAAPESDVSTGRAGSSTRATPSRALPDPVPCQETFALSHAGQNRRWLRPRPRRTTRAPSSCVLASDDSDSTWINERSLTRHSARGAGSALVRRGRSAGDLVDVREGSHRGGDVGPGRPLALELVALAGPRVLEGHRADVEASVDGGGHPSPVERVPQDEALVAGGTQQVDPERADGDDDALPARRGLGGRVGPDPSGATDPQSASSSLPDHGAVGGSAASREGEEAGGDDVVACRCRSAADHVWFEAHGANSPWSVT